MLDCTQYWSYRGKNVSSNWDEFEQIILELIVAPLPSRPAYQRLTNPKSRVLFFCGLFLLT